MTERVGSPRVDKLDTGIKVTHQYDVNYDAAEDALTTAGFVFGAAHPVPYVASVLMEISIEKDGPKNAIVTLVYYPVTWSAKSPEKVPPVGTVELYSDSNAQEVPLRMSASVSTSNYDRTRNIGIGDLEGIHAFLDPRPVFGRIETLSGFTFSEANVVANVAKRFSTAQMTTRGLTGATKNFWLQMRLQVRQAGDKYQKTEEWQYSEMWSDVLYGAAVGS